MRLAGLRTYLRKLTIAGAMAFGFVGMFLSAVPAAHAAPSAQASLSARIINPPNAVTNLVASQVGAPNEVQLVWTAPSNANGATITHYLVRFATFPAPGVAAGEAWWSGLSVSERIISPAHAPGVTEFGAISGLSNGVTFYFGIKSVDIDGQVSGVDVRVGSANQAAAMSVSSTPATPTGLTGLALSSTSLQWSWSLSAGATYYQLRTSSGGVILSTASSPAVETGLTPNTSYTRTISAGNGLGISTPSATVTVYTLGAVPSGLAESTHTANSASMSWAANGNPAGTNYRIERSTDGVTFTVVATTTSLSVTDTGLTGSTTYYYRVRSVNGNGVASGPSSTITVVTDPTTDTLAPDLPLGLKVSMDPARVNFNLIWEQVTKNADNTAISDLAFYRIYKSSAPGVLGVLVGTAPTTNLSYSETVNGAINYYIVRAVDLNGNESASSYSADSTGQKNVTFVASNGRTQVVMPDSVNDLMRSSGNKYGTTIKIVLDELSIPASMTELVRYVRLKLVRSDTNQEIRDLAFQIPDTTLKLSYDQIGGFVAKGVRSSLTQTNATPDQLSMYWSNDVTWVKVGGTLDTTNQTVNIKTSFLGAYQLRISAQSTSLALSDMNVFPRIFTPNGDGLNDFVYFVLENPNRAGVVGELYDVNGRFVRTMPPPAQAPSIGTTLIWDGKDLNGSVVPSGVYIYRIRGEGKSFTGTIVVAR